MSGGFTLTAPRAAAVLAGGMLFGFGLSMSTMVQPQVVPMNARAGTAAQAVALRAFIKDTGLKMIQWRNFNIDPDWYLGRINLPDSGEILGIKQLMELIKEEFPEIKYGYYNPPMERIKGNFEVDFAH